MNYKVKELIDILYKCPFYKTDVIFTLDEVEYIINSNYITKIVRFLENKSYTIRVLEDTKEYFKVSNKITDVECSVHKNTCEDRLIFIVNNNFLEVGVFKLRRGGANNEDKSKKNRKANKTCNFK